MCPLPPLLKVKDFMTVNTENWKHILKMSPNFSRKKAAVIQRYLMLLHYTETSSERHHRKDKLIVRLAKGVVIC